MVDMGMPVWDFPGGEKATQSAEVKAAAERKIDRTVAGGPAHRNIERVLDPKTGKVLGYQATTPSVEPPAPVYKRHQA